MPLLAREPGLYPEDLFTNGHLEDGRRWWVARTRPRREKSLARFLLQNRLPFYLPQYEKIWRSSGRNRRAWLPLFPCYLFLRGTCDERTEAVFSGHVAQALEVPEQTEILEDLRRIRRAETSERVLEELTDWYEPGRQVRINAGPLAGLEGVIEERRGRRRLIVSVRFIGRAVAVELDPADVGPG